MGDFSCIRKPKAIGFKIEPMEEVMRIVDVTLPVTLRSSLSIQANPQGNIGAPAAPARKLATHTPFEYWYSEKINSKIRDKTIIRQPENRSFTVEKNLETKMKQNLPPANAPQNNVVICAPVALLHPSCFTTYNVKKAAKLF